MTILALFGVGTLIVAGCNTWLRTAPLAKAMAYVSSFLCFFVLDHWLNTVSTDVQTTRIAIAELAYFGWEIHVHLFDLLSVVWLLGAVWKFTVRVNSFMDDRLSVVAVVNAVVEACYWWIPASNVVPKKRRMPKPFPVVPLLAFQLAILLGLAFGYYPHGNAVVEEWAHEIGTRLNTEVWAYKSLEQTAPELKWGQSSLPLIEVDQGTSNFFVPAFDRDSVRAVFSDPWILYSPTGLSIPLQEMRGFLVAADAKSIHHFDDYSSCAKALLNHFTEAPVTVYIRLEGLNRPYFSAFTLGEERDFAISQQSLKRLFPEKRCFAWASPICEGEVRATDPEYLFSWGPIVRPLIKVGAPNVFGETLDITEEEFLLMLREGLSFSNTGDPVDIVSIFGFLFTDAHEPSFSPGSFGRTSHYGQTETEVPPIRFGLRFEKMDDHLFRLNDKTISALLQMDLAGMHIALWGETKDFDVSQLILNVDDPQQFYRPPFKVPGWKEAPVSTWQVVQIPDIKTILKYDPQDTTIQSILAMYADSSRFQLLPIHGFESYARLRRQEDDPLFEKDFETIDYRKEAGSPWQLPELVARDSLYLRWGSLSSLKGETIGYSMDELRMNLDESLTVLADGRMLEPIAGRVTVLQKGAPPVSYRFDDFFHPTFQAALRQIGPRSTVLIDQLIIEIDRRAHYVPEGFVFGGI